MADDRSEEAELEAAAQYRRDRDRSMSMSERLAALQELCEQLAPVEGAVKRP